jgi:hypothetical protein
MTVRALERKIETMERRIEDFKWLLAESVCNKTVYSSNSFKIIRLSSGILGRTFPNGISYENRIRKGWRNNLLSRAA